MITAPQVSQYPFETEICFPPLCALTVDGKRVEGSLLIVQLSACTRTSSAYSGEIALLEASRKLQIAEEEEARRQARGGGSYAAVCTVVTRRLHGGYTAVTLRD